MEFEIRFRLGVKLDELNIMLKNYQELNKETRGTYRWREHAIEAQIDALEQLRDNTKANWLECYNEDMKESSIRRNR